jgi:PAS domain S-box-containing protein
METLSTTSPKAKVLVIDDQFDNLRLMHKILHLHGHEVRLATSGEMGLASVETDPPDLIILDIAMPDMDGYAVCRALKQSPQSRDIPVIFISALDEVKNIVEAFEVGGVEYITRPFQTEEVLVRVENQIAKCRMRRALQRRVAIEELVTTVSTRFLGVTSEDREQEILHTLQDIGGFAGVDTCSLLLFGKDEWSVALSYEWHRGGEVRCIKHIEEMNLPLFNWTIEMLQNGEIITIPQVEDLPVEARREKESWQQRGHISVLGIPLTLRKKLIGFLGCTSQQHTMFWGEEDRRLLHVMGDIFVNVFARQQMEDSLRQSEARYRALFEGATNPVTLYDKDGTILLLNQSGAANFNRPVEDFIGKNLASFLPDKHDITVRRVRRVIETEVAQSFEDELEVPSGKKFYWTVMQPIANAQGEVDIVQAISYDITERKHGEQRQQTQLEVTCILAAASSQESALPDLLQALCRGLEWQFGEMWQVDHASDKLYRSHVWYEPELAATTFAQQDIVQTFARGEGLPGVVWKSGQPVWITEIPNDPHFIRVATAARAGLQGSFAFQIESSGGFEGVMCFFSHEVRHFDETLSRMMSNIGRQIGQFLQRKRAEEAFEAEHARFEWVVDQTDQGFLIVNQHDEIVYANRQARIYLNLPESVSESYESTHYFLEYATQQYHYHPIEAWRDWQERLIPFALMTEDHQPLRYLVRPETPTSQPLWLHVEVLDLPSKSPTHLICLRDVTEQMTRQRQMWTFHALISHKLNTPMSCLINSLYLLQELVNGQSDERASEYSTIALDSAQRLHQQLRNIRHFLTTPDLARPGEECPLSRLPQIVAQVSQELQIEHVHFTATEKLDHTCLVLSDQALALLFRQVLENAKKFHPTQTPNVTVLVDRPSRQELHITVQDNGVTLAPEQLKHVWVPYYQVEKHFSGQVPGMGLGLAIVAALLWSVGGSYRIMNCEPGPGVMVVLIVPVQESLYQEGLQEERA